MCPVLEWRWNGTKSRFYQEELQTRARLGYPPFAEMIRLVTVADRSRAGAGGRAVPGGAARPPFRRPDGARPGAAADPAGRSRWHVLVQRAGRRAQRAIVAQALAQLAEPYRQRGVVLLVDVDPLSFG